MKPIAPSPNHRITSIDILRGLAMVLMAIDHVRVYSGIPASSLDAGVFFTRWITHFCAPAFTFFAGTSIFLMGHKMKSKVQLTRQLLVRGLILIALELTLLHYFWTFNTNFGDFILAGVIWMLGCCMMLMATLIWLNPKVVGLIGLAIILFQQAFSNVPPLVPESISENFLLFWRFIYPTGFENPQTDTVAVLYVIVPWIGVMALGYAFGMLFRMEAEKRKKFCVAIGLGMIVMFLMMGTIRVLGSDNTGSRPFIFALLGQQKYPASSLFLMMTLGPLILAIPFVENVKGWLIKVLNLIGRVPLFFYLLHILLIHLSALVVQLILDGSMHPEWFNYAPFTFVPKASQWSLYTLYLVFIVDVVVLYFLCKWYANYKVSHPEKKWLRYL